MVQELIEQLMERLQSLSELSSRPRKRLSSKVRCSTCIVAGVTGAPATRRHRFFKQIKPPKASERASEEPPEAHFDALGTICALLLAKLYELSGAEAMARAQLYHDVRQQPVFCAEGYEETKDGSSCVMLFPCQRLQVQRLLREPLQLDRACSVAYGAGASKYSPEVMAEWKEGLDAVFGVERC